MTLTAPHAVDSAKDSDAVNSPPVLAIYAMALSPYETHLYRRIARETPLRVATLVAKRDASRDWSFEGIDEIGLEDLSGGDRVGSVFSLSAQRREWRRGGVAIERLKRLGADALILVGYNDLGRLRVASWCRRHGVPVLLRADSNLADEQGKSPLKTALKRRYIALVDRLASAILAVGPLGVEYWRHYGVAAEKIFVSPYEPDYSLLATVSDDELATAAQRYGIDRTRRRFVFSGRLARQKRVDLLIQSFIQIAHQRSEWDLLLIGDGELRQELQALVPAELQDRVQWTGFLAEQRDIGLLYKLSDALVLPSDFEPWAVVVNEAAAGGLALVCSDVVGAASALLRPGVNGEFFTKGDLEGLASAMRRISDPAAIDRYRAASLVVLDEWRRDADPVEGVCRALRHAGLEVARATT